MWVFFVCAFSRTQTALLAWLQKQLQAKGPLPLAALEQVPPAMASTTIFPPCVTQQHISFLTFFFVFRVLCEQQYFVRDYRLPFSQYYPRGLMTFIVTHSRSLAMRQGRVYWLNSR
jgi:hypothetical protein